MKLNFLRQYFKHTGVGKIRAVNARSEPLNPAACDNSNSKGRQAEQLCKAYLVENGWHLVRENFSCKLGEVDLIMQKLDLLLFIEVRYRKSTHHGSGAASVTASKQRKLLAAIQFFLQRTPGYSSHASAYRIDVMEVSPGANFVESDDACGEQELSYANHNIRWIKNAFS